jgi:hypothetical protein
MANAVNLRIIAMSEEGEEGRDKLHEEAAVLNLC